MTFEIKKILIAYNLPNEWDNLVVDYFQTKEFLIHTETYNSCNQRYYLFLENDELKAGAIVYSLKLDIFTYIGIASPFSMKIIGVPCSVSSSGLVGKPELSTKLIEHILKQEKGFHLALNLDDKNDKNDVVNGRTLPTIILKNRFTSLENYLQSIKSNYRRRFLKLSLPFSEVKIKRGRCSNFNKEMHTQYLDVLKHSKGKLETLSHDFFVYLPSNFYLTEYYHQQKLIGWYITTMYFDKFYFFLGGIDYKLNNKFNTYFNILLGVLKDGIKKKARIIDFGQTAEIPKTRLGGKLVEKYMIGSHSNILMRKLLKGGKTFLEYNTKVPKTNVFN